MGYLVLEILGGHEGVEQELAAGSRHGLDLAAGAGALWIDLEGLPQVVDAGAAGLSAGVDQDAHVGIKYGAEGLEEPAMRINLLLVVLLEAEQDLHGGGGLAAGDELDHVPLAQFDSYLGGILALGQLQVHIQRKDGGKNLVDVGGDIGVVDLGLGDSLLVTTHASEHAAGAGVDLAAAVADDADDHLLPGILAPGLGAGARAQVGHVLEDAGHGAREQHLVLVVHGDHDEELGGAWFLKQLLAQGEALGDKVGRVAGNGRVAHVGELALVVHGQHLQQPLGYGAVEHQVAAKQLDALDRLPAPHAAGLWRGRGRGGGGGGVRDGRHAGREVRLLGARVAQGRRRRRGGVAGVQHGPAVVVVRAAISVGAVERSIRIGGAGGGGRRVRLVGVG